MALSEYLSVWEIAHRWQSIDPNKTDSENLPIEIQDSLRYLCRLVLRGSVPLHEEIFFTEERNGRNIHESFIQLVEELPPEIIVCVTDRKYHKLILDGFLLNRVELFALSVFKDVQFPEFWWDDKMVEAVGGQFISTSAPDSKAQNQDNARTSVLDKSICQAVAKTLWDIYPDINISDMTKHPSILKYGGGVNYPGKNTLSDWLRVVAPENIKNKPGRPKTKKPNTDAA